MAVTALSALKINQIYSMGSGTNGTDYFIPNSWLAVEWTNTNTDEHVVYLQTRHVSALEIKTASVVTASSNVGGLNTFNFPSGTTRALIPFMPLTSTSYITGQHTTYTNDALILRAYAATTTQTSTVVSLTTVLNASLQSVTTSTAGVVTVGHSLWLSGPFPSVASYSNYQVFMPGHPEGLSATAVQQADKSVALDFPFLGAVMYPASAPAILLPQSDNNNRVHPLSLPPVVAVKMYNAAGAEAHSGTVYPSQNGAPMRYSIPASAVTVTGQYLITATLRTLLPAPSSASTVVSVVKGASQAVNGDFPAPTWTIGDSGGGWDLDVFFSGSVASGTRSARLQAMLDFSIIESTKQANLYGTASGVSVPAFVLGRQMESFREESALPWATVMTLTAPAVTSGEGGGEGNANMFSWLNNDYWYLTDLQVNLGTRAVTHRHGTVQIKPNDTINFAVLFHNGSAGVDPVATDLRLAVRSSANTSAYHFWSAATVTTAAVSGDTYYTITVTASDEDLLAAQAAGLLAGSNAAQSLLAEVQWTTTRGTFSSDTFTISVPNEVVREPDV